MLNVYYFLLSSIRWGGESIEVMEGSSEKRRSLTRRQHTKKRYKDLGKRKSHGRAFAYFKTLSIPQYLYKNTYGTVTTPGRV